MRNEQISLLIKLIALRLIERYYINSNNTVKALKLIEKVKL